MKLLAMKFRAYRSIEVISWPRVAVSLPFRGCVGAVSWPYSGRVVAVSWPLLISQFPKLE